MRQPEGGIARLEADRRQAHLVDQAIWPSEMIAEVGKARATIVEMEAPLLALIVKMDPPIALYANLEAGCD